MRDWIIDNLAVLLPSLFFAGYFTSKILQSLGKFKQRKLLVRLTSTFAIPIYKKNSLGCVVLPIDYQLIYKGTVVYEGTLYFQYELIYEYYAYGEEERSQKREQFFAIKDKLLRGESL